MPGPREPIKRAPLLGPEALTNAVRCLKTWRGNFGVIALSASLLGVCLIHNTFTVRALFYAYLLIFAYEFIHFGAPLRQAASLFWNSILVRGVLVFLAYAFLSTFWSADVTWDDVFRGGVKCLAILLFVLSLMFYGHRASSLIASAIVLGATANCTVSVLLFFASGHQPFIDRLAGIGMKANAISTVSLYAVAILIISLSHSLKSRVAKGLICSLLLMGVMLSMSRGPLWALVVAVLSGAAAQQRKSVFLVCLTTLLSVVAVAFFTNHMGDYYESMMRHSGRVAIWREAVAKLSADDLHLLIGYGLSDKTIYTLPGQLAGAPPLVFKDLAHDAYLSNLTKTGIIGSCMLLFVIMHGLRLARKHAGPHPLLLGWLVFALSSMLTDYLIIKSFGLEFVLFWLPIGWLCHLEISSVRHFTSIRSTTVASVPARIAAGSSNS